MVDSPTDEPSSSDEPREPSAAAPAIQAGPQQPAEAPRDQPEAPGAGRINVGWVIRGQTLGQFSRTLQPLAIGLLDELINVEAFCPQGADVGQLPSPPVNITRYGRMNWLFFRTAAMEGLREEIRSREIKLLHAIDAGAAALTARLARLSGLPYVVSSYRVGDGRRLGGPGHHAAAILAASQAVQADLARRHPGDPQRVCLVRPGVYHVRHATCFDNPQCSMAVVAGGALDDVAAFDAVLHSFAQLQRTYDCVFFIMGSGRGERQIRNQAETLGLHPLLTFIDPPRVDQLMEIYRAADIYVSPSVSDTVDMQSLLAMAAGVPVIAAGGASDFLIDGQTAQTFRSGDAEELTRKLAAWLDDHAAARAMAERALAHLHEAHSAAGMVSQVAQVYRQCL